MRPKPVFPHQQPDGRMWPATHHWWSGRYYGEILAWVARTHHTHSYAVRYAAGGRPPHVGPAEVGAQAAVVCRGRPGAALVARATAGGFARPIGLCVALGDALRQEQPT